MNDTNFLFVGVGGQGILTASDIVAEVGLAAGLDAKKSEIHGFSQRGGVVESHVRWGQRVGAPVAELGTVDFLVSFELLESARFVEHLRPNAVVITNTQRIIPMSVSSGGYAYPADGDIEKALRSRTDQIYRIDALAVAQELGNPRLVNTVVLGALSWHVPVDAAVWLDVISRRVPPRHLNANRQAFDTGRSS